MKTTVVPNQSEDGKPFVVTLPSGKRIPPEGMSVELTRFISDRIREGALKVAAEEAPKPSKKAEKDK